MTDLYVLIVKDQDTPLTLAISYTDFLLGEEQIRLAVVEKKADGQVAVGVARQMQLLCRP